MTSRFVLQILQIFCFHFLWLYNRFSDSACNLTRTERFCWSI